MQTALQFARWFITKHQGTVYDVSNVDDAAWAEYMATDEAIEASKAAVAQIIPQVVEKMPAKKKAAAPRPRKTKVDAQAQTIGEDCAQDSPAEVAAAEVAAEEKKPKKKTSKKPAKLATEDPVAQVAAEESAAEVAEAPAVEEKKPKKKTSKKTAEEPVAEAAAEVAAEEKKPKKSTKKAKAVEEPAEVVVPEAEAEQLAHSPNYSIDGQSLCEEPYEQETEYEEIRLGETLYYVDSNDNWLDAEQQPIDKPVNA
jgi:hypothetical protein